VIGTKSTLYPRLSNTSVLVVLKENPLGNRCRYCLITCAWKMRSPEFRSGMCCRAKKSAMRPSNHFPGMRHMGLWTSPVRWPITISCWLADGTSFMSWSSVCCPSASRVAISGICACRMPVFSAAPYPRLARCVNTRRMCGCARVNSARMSAVPSEEPSSMTRISHAIACCKGSRDSSTLRITGASL